ncbi:f-box and wd-40 domain-containing cdc4 [Trichoderma cornu-damae]|uniref:F-box and wd-40 domain-containing cdc4 n=1 Tax=Trichoderma cornu-damae TaxID=654480 RepID=A0A9P8TYK7_9HYPO|nr:f-box and wd-40 domain-containing cdc4 [Trichoderma cornu-damae]
MTPSPSSQQGLEPRRPRSAHTQTVSVNIAESTPPNGSRRFQLHVSECVETKTVTTTTRLTRKFPQVFIRDPAPLDSLDAKEYPLAMKPAPPELADFSYRFGADEHDFGGKMVEDPHEYADSQLVKRSLSIKQEAIKQESISGEMQTTDALSRISSASPSEPYSHRRSHRLAAAESPTASATRAPQRLARSSNLHAVSNRLRRPAMQGGSGSGGVGGSGGSNLRHDAGDRVARNASIGVLATPDITETAEPLPGRSMQRRPVHLDYSPNSQDLLLRGRSKSPPYEASSPAGSDAHTFSSTVATPPITDADPESFADDTDESLEPSLRPQHRPAIDVVAAQDASLPSPRLSPTLAAAQLHPAEPDEDARSSFKTSTTDRWMAESQATQDGGFADELSFEDPSRGGRALVRRDQPVIVDPQTLLEAFDSMKTEMKTFMMYQFLRRCPRPTLRIVADAVNPALQCDFLQRLPLELSYHILSYLDFRDLSRAAQVSKHWRNIVDRNETGWKELFDKDGFTLPPGELNKAIVQGWGWQDPAGADGYEQDLSMQNRLTSSDKDLTQALRQEAVPKARSSKRKRALNAYAASDRSKRRASAQEVAANRDDRAQGQVKLHKSAGPLSAAHDALLAVPDPQLGLPSLRQLHLYKSLYRRHYMIRHSWTDGATKPSHVAFAAHPRHVITCLQFDDDKIITGSDDTLIHIYDTKTGKLRRKLEGHEGGVWALQYEGNILVSGSTDRSVRVWDIERGLCQQVFYGHTSTVRCLQILMPTATGMAVDGTPIMQPEKPLIITGSRDSQLRVWRLPEVGSRRYIQTGPPAQESDCPYFIRVLTGHTHSVRAISAHGDILVSGSYDSTVRVWRISTGDALHVLHGHTQKVYSVVLDHERNRCISGSMDSLVKIWDLATGACLYTLEGHSLLVGLLDLRDDRLVSAAADSTLRIWDPQTGKCRNTLMAHTGAITCFQHDGRKVISGSEKTVKMWDVRTGECVQDLLTDLSGVWQVKFDGRRCVAAVQRDNFTYVEILDFGAVRDGHPPEELGRRILLNETEVRTMMEEEV